MHFKLAFTNPAAEKYIRILHTGSAIKELAVNILEPSLLGFYLTFPRSSLYSKVQELTNIGVESNLGFVYDSTSTGVSI